MEQEFYDSNGDDGGLGEEPALPPALDRQTIGEVHRSLNTTNPETPPSNPTPAPGNGHGGCGYPYKPPRFHNPMQSIVVVVPASAYGMPDIVESFTVGSISTRSPGSLAALRLLMFIWRACYEVQRGLGKMEPPRKRKRRGDDDDSDSDEPDPDPRLGDLFDHQPSEMPFTYSVDNPDGTTSGAPRIEMVRECLMGNDGRVAAMRFTFQSNDPSICMNQMIYERIIRYGIEQTEANTRRTFVVNNAVTASEAASSKITSVEVWARTLVEYFGSNSIEGRLLNDKMHQMTTPNPEMSIRNPQNPGCPTEALTFERTASIVQKTVCKDQLVPTNYGIQAGGVFYYKKPIAKNATFGMALRDPVETFYSMSYIVPRQMAIWVDVLNRNRMLNEQFRILVPKETRRLVKDEIRASVRSDFAQPEAMVMSADSPTMSESDEWALRSFTERRRRIYGPITEEIRRIRPADDENPADPDVQRRTDEFNDRMTRFIESKIDEVWDEDFCHPENLVSTASAAQVAAVQHIATMTPNDWPDFPKVAKNMTLSGSLITAFFNRMMQAFKVKPGATPRNTLVMWLGGLAVSVWRPGICGANVSIFDGPAAGKSFMLTTCHDMLLPGAVRNGSVMTPKALTAAGSWVGMTFFFHEAGPAHFGLDPNGRPTAKDDNGVASLLKTALTEGLITTTSLTISEDGKRVPIVQRSRVGSAFHFASNAMPRLDPNSLPAMLTRTIRIENGGTHAVTDEAEEVWLSSSTSTEHGETIKGDFIRETRTIHALVLMVGMLIDMGVLPMPNIDVGIRILRNLEEFVTQKGYEKINPRKQEQIESLFIGLVLQTAVMKVASSELALKYRPDPSGVARPIGPWFFKEVRKHLVLDTEMAFFVLTLVPEMIMPALPSSVMRRLNDLIEGKQLSTVPLTTQVHSQVIEDQRFVVADVPMSGLAEMVASGLNGVTNTAVLEVLNLLFKRTYTGSGAYLIEKRTKTGMPVNNTVPSDGMWTVRIFTRIQSGNESGRARIDRFGICRAALAEHAAKSARALFIQFITETLRHAHANARTIITALPMEIKNNGSDVPRTINALMTIDVYPVPEQLQAFRNGYRVRICDQVLGQARMNRPLVLRDTGLPMSFATSDYDDEAVLTFGRNIGMTEEEAAGYTPKALTDAAHFIRAERADLFDTPELAMLEHYPETYMTIRSEEIKLNNMCPAKAMTPALAHAMENDVMFRSSVIGRRPVWLSPAAESSDDLFGEQTKPVQPPRVRKSPSDMIADRIKRMQDLMEQTKTAVQKSPRAKSATSQRLSPPRQAPPPSSMVDQEPFIAGAAVVPARKADVLQTVKGASSFLRSTNPKRMRVVTVEANSQ